VAVRIGLIGLALALGSCVTVALGEPSAPPPPPTGTTPTTPTTTTAPARTTPGVPPKLASFRLSASVTAQQGHARFLVGLTTSTPARVSIQVASLPSKRLVKTVRTTDLHPAGRVWVLVEGTDDRSFQLPAGSYRITAQATDAASRASNVLVGNMTLKLTPPRGLFDGYVVPAWQSDVAGVAPAPGGEIVTALVPGGALVTAGIRRGDVIRAIGGRPVDSPGAMTAALRALRAGTPVQVDYDRAGVRTSGIITAKPDWTRVPDYGPAFDVILRRAPGILAFQYAAAKQRLDVGKPGEAKTDLSAWSAVDRGSAPGEMLSAALQATQAQPKQALAAYNRALVRDPQLAQAQFGRGVSLSALGRFADAAAAFGEAARLDPADASALAFRAYSLLRLDQDAGALKAATQAVVLDPGYEEAHLARGLTLLALGRVPEGVSELKHGLLLTGDPKRAQQIITANLEPATP